jgi:hypothetical protein
MDEFILAGLLFHVGAAASLALVSAISGLIDARRRNAATARGSSNTPAVIVLSARPRETAS